MKGFTLIELLIVVAISAMLSSIAVVYSSIERNQITLSVETAKIAGFILQAKNLAIATYGGETNACAYGVSFASSTYSIFAFSPSSAPPCPSAASTTAVGISAADMSPYSVNSWKVPLAGGVRMKSGGNGDDLVIILFYPPAPAALISRGGGNFLDPRIIPNITSKVYLTTTDGKASSMISVNAAGQVSF